MQRSRTRRALLQAAAAGSVVAIGGVLFKLADGKKQEIAKRYPPRADGKPRLPPGQTLIAWMRPMGGVAGDPSPSAFRLRVHGEVKKPFELDYAELLRLPQVERGIDVHCVTGWSLFDLPCKGVPVAHLAELAGVKETARHVIFEAEAGYTANVRLDEALHPDALVTHRLYGDPIETAHGAPVRGIVPDLYFWKSAKWLTGIRFSAVDEPGYWETRGYHNHADPWLEERYA